MRSIETLVREYPEKTGTEILRIQKEDIIEDQKIFYLLNKDNLKLIEDHNVNGSYYRGTFGLNQYYYYRFFDLEFMEGCIMCSVEKITCFKATDKHWDVNIDIMVKNYQQFESYGIDIICERITKEDFYSVKNYINDIFDKFWKPIN